MDVVTSRPPLGVAPLQDGADVLLSVIPVKFDDSVGVERIFTGNITGQLITEDAENDG